MKKKKRARSPDYFFYSVKVIHNFWNRLFNRITVLDLLSTIASWWSEGKREGNSIIDGYSFFSPFFHLYYYYCSLVCLLLLIWIEVIDNNEWNQVELRKKRRTTKKKEVKEKVEKKKDKAKKQKQKNLYSYSLHQY